VVWTDHLARGLIEVSRRTRVPRVYDAVVPFLLAVFVVAPIGLLILPFFIPKFVRNWQRRNRYLPSGPMGQSGGLWDRALKWLNDWWTALGMPKAGKATLPKIE